MGSLPVKKSRVRKISGKPPSEKISHENISAELLFLYYKKRGQNNKAQLFYMGASIEEKLTWDNYEPVAFGSYFVPRVPSPRPCKGRGWGWGM